VFGTGQSIAIAHRPPRITLHSVQDGHEERVLHIQSSAATPTREHHITKIWWFQQEKVKVVNSIPDIFGRNNIIVCVFSVPYSGFDSSEHIKTGSAHSILKMLPLLDHLADEVQKTT
jgi:anaphase-promoting complex subunit 4